jgi:Ca-activated chloride channel family protein
MKIIINSIRPALCDSNQDFHVLIRLQSEPQKDFKRTPLKLTLVVDRSGSMQGSKLREAKRCVLDLVKRMNPEDQVGVVQYDDHVDTVMPLSPVEQVSSVIEDLVLGITANGSTDLHAGWLRGGEMLAPSAGRDATCHVILLSDGQANRGIQTINRICEQVSALASAGVTTTTVGLGEDFNEELMTAMAQAGHGRAHYGERAIDLAETFDAEIGLLSQLQWRNVEMSILNGTDQMKLLNTYERAGDEWRMPSIAMGSECWALMRIPMRTAILLQENHGTAVSVKVQAVDASGQPFTFEGQLPKLPVVFPAQYEAELNHELVERRMNEIAASQIQLQIREAALQGDWTRVEQLFSQLEALGRNEPWVAASIAFTKQLIRDRDERRMSKEMLYKSRKMEQRLSSSDEVMFSLRNDIELPAFLRRKSTEGRRSEI